MPETKPNLTRTYEIQSKMDKVVAFQLQLIEIMRENGFIERGLFCANLCLEEALANAVKHGNQSDPTKKVWVTYTLNPAGLTITITDEGSGFNPASVPDPTSKENIERECGRGLLLMRIFAQSVTYNQVGNSIILQLTPEGVPSQEPVHA